jgi:hypothetical protein
MAVYEGVLQKFSGGSSLSGRWTRREFIDIGDQRVKFVAFSSYHDELLQESLGKEIAISTYGSGRRRKAVKRVVAMRTEQGLDRCSVGFLLANFLGGWVAAWMLAVIVAVPLLLSAVPLAVGIGWLFGHKDLGGIIGFVFVGVVVLFLLFAPFVDGVKQRKAWAALSPEHPEQGSRVLAGS